MIKTCLFNSNDYIMHVYTMLMSHASVDFLVLSFVLPCAYGYVASENYRNKGSQILMCSTALNI